MRFLVLLLALVPFSPAQSAEIIAAVTGPRIEAQEIAAALDGWRPTDPSVDLAPSPSPGSPRRISRALLETWTHAAGANAAALPDSIVIERRLTPLTPDSAAAIIGSAVAKKTALETAAIEVEVPANQKLPAPPAGELEWSLIGNPPDPREETELRLRWRDAGGRSGVELIRARVQARGKWLAAERNIPARQAVSAADFRLDRGFLPSLKTAYLTNFEFDQSYELKRHMKQDEPLDESLLRRRPDVQRGDLLQLEVRSGPVALSAPARAETDAEIGQSIRLKNIETGRIIVGRVVSPEAAEAELP